VAFSTTEEQIDAAERELGTSFPAELRERLQVENGGEIAVADWPELWQLFPVRDDSDKRRIKRSANHIVRENESLADLRDHGELPADAIAVATNGGGDLLVLTSEGSFAVWDHETAELEAASVVWNEDA
jgi:hypothetical protein